MKHKKWIILCALLFICIFLLFKWNKNFLLLWNANHIHVTADEPLQKEKVQIRFGISSHAFYRDSGYFANKDKYNIIYDRQTAKELINEYGENDFLIIYDNRYYLPFRQFKTNRRHQHDYYFHFFQRNDSIFVKVNIEGINDRKFESLLTDSQQSDSLKNN